jgi:SAM-dependent methyltransferase
MGISRSVEGYEKKVMQKLNLKYNGLIWCELGNQINYNKVPAKRVYESLGVKHTSMDLNGKDGSIIINLDLPVSKEFLKKFDFITNYGTLEHVDNQYQSFKNMHDMLKKGGKIITLFPLIGHWSYHCRFYYSQDFVNDLAKACNYKIEDLEILDKNEFKRPRNMVAVTFTKLIDNKFISNEQFRSLKGLKDSGYTARTGNYTKNIIKLFRSILRI